MANTYSKGISYVIINYYTQAGFISRGAGEKLVCPFLPQEWYIDFLTLLILDTFLGPFLRS